MKQSLTEFIDAYRQHAGPVCNELWDAADTAYVAHLYAPPREEDDDDRD